MLNRFQCRRHTTMSDCNWRTCLVTLSLAFIHTCASTQRQAQRPETLLQIASTEASEYSSEPSLAFSDLPDSNAIDAGPSSVTAPDVSESNSFYPELSSSETGQDGNDADVGSVLATRGSFLQLPPPASFLHLQPVDSLAVAGPQGQVEDGSPPSPPIPSLRIPSTVAKLTGSAAPSAQSRAVGQEGQRQRPEIELLTGMQRELTKLSREVETLAAMSASSPARIDSGLHFIGTGGRDSQTAAGRKAVSDGKSAGPGTTAATDAIGDASVYSKIGMIVPVVLQICLVVAIASCVLHLHADFQPSWSSWLAVFVFLIIADIIWVCVCLTGVMDDHVRQGVAVSICILLVVGNIVIICILVCAIARKNKFVKAVHKMPDDIIFVKTVVNKMLLKLDEICGKVSDGVDDVKHMLDPEFDSSDENEDVDAATKASGDAIRITIIKAMDLPETNKEKFPYFLGSGSNSYCSCAVRGRREFQFKTKTELGSTDPKWHHRHLFKYLWPEDVLVFKVWDIQEKLGEYEAPLQDLQAQWDILQTKGQGEMTLDLVVPKRFNGTGLKPRLVVRIEPATAQHLDTASRFNGTGL